MKREPVNEKTIFTVGHSNHGLEKFLKLLQDSHIDMVIDIRSRPYSCYVPHFNKASISNSLQTRGIKYQFLGDKLGGKLDDKRFYDSNGHMQYSLIAQTPGFREGIEKLLKMGRECRMALMCSEENPGNCHRYLLVSLFLEKKGVKVIHIRGDGRQQVRGDLAGENEAKIGEIQQKLFNALSGASNKSGAGQDLSGKGL